MRRLGKVALAATALAVALAAPCPLWALEAAAPEAAALEEAAVTVDAGETFAADEAPTTDEAPVTDDAMPAEAPAAIEEAPVAPAATDEQPAPGLSVEAHVADIGWMAPVEGGATAGTTGRNLSLEALRVALTGIEDGSTVELRAHVSNIGWQDWTTDMAGTTGKALGIEALQLRLTGPASEQYDLWYRVHVADLGWLGWTSNGQEAGTTGRALACQAIEVVLLPKGSAAPGDEADSFLPNLKETTFAQVGETTTFTAMPAWSERLAAAGADTMRLVATVSYRGVETRRVETSCALSELPEGGLSLDVGGYGPWNVEAAYLDGDKVVAVTHQEVGISAREYNLAPLSASFPVVLFSLSYWDIQTAADGTTIPTVVMLDRPSAYDWDALPEGMYSMPLLKQGSTPDVNDYQIFADYVGELYRLNPQAHFNLYINDITCTYIHEIIYANGIPEGSYKITMLSDGSGTYGITNETFAVADPQAKQDELVAQWNEAKAYAYATGTVAAGYGYHEHWDSMYAVLTCEPGTEWWMTRTNLFTSGDNNVFANQIATNPGVVAKNVATMLTNLQAKGDDVVAELKAMYKFNEGYFTDAEESGKQVMLLLGTYVNMEDGFDAYAELTSMIYGDTYAYYYKGHPNTPTRLYPEKQEQLDNLGIVDIDSSVAAELILFYNPEVAVSGYGSSTFNSVSADQAGGLFGMTKAQALSDESTIDYSGMDWFASPVTEETDEALRALCPEGHDCYLVEFSDEMLRGERYDIAIYDANAGAMARYERTRSGDYKLVDEVYAPAGVTGEAHVSDIGWMDPVLTGATVGTTGQAKSLEAVELTLRGVPCEGSIRYQAHVSEIGWQDWVADGELAGTTGKALPMEAIRIELTGEAAERYDVVYRAHVADLGWLDWVQNGELAGTTGQARHMEALQVKLVPKA